MRLAVPCCLVIAAVVLPPVAGAATFAPTRFDDPTPGACLASDCSLREAVMAANLTSVGDTIQLQAGTYALTHAVGSDTQAFDLDVVRPLVILGASAGSKIRNDIAIVNGETRLFDVKATTLTTRGLALRGGEIDAGRGGCVRVVDGSVSFGTGSIAGCTAPVGGGMSVDGGTISLTGSLVYRNEGTGIAVTDGTLRLGNSHVEQNVGDRGGGVYVDGATRSRLTATGSSSVSDNAASLGGGVMVEWGTSLDILGPAGGWLVIDDNAARANGGGILGGFGEVTLFNVAVTGNVAAGFGGGLALHAVEGVRVRVGDNQAGGGGGGLYVQGAGSGLGCWLDASTFSRNEAGGDGGGVLYSGGGNFDLSNASFHQNTAQRGGAIAAHGMVRMQHVTSYEDAAPIGASFVHVANPGTLNGSGATNSALLEGCALVGAVTLSSQGGNTQFTGTSSCGFSHADDLPPQTPAQVDAVFGNYGGGMSVVGLLATSTLVDAARQVVCADRDVRDYVRPATCDIGAFEVGATAP